MHRGRSVGLHFQTGGCRPAVVVVTALFGKMKQDPEKVNILLVDDRRENLLALEGILKDLGENLIQARSGAETLKYLLKNDAAVILLDVEMPDMDGFQTATLIRERQKSSRTPIIFLTAI